MAVSVALVMLSLGFAFTSAGIVSTGDNKTPPSFGKGLNTHNFQQWDDWIKKRSRFSSPWTQGDFSGDKFQQWQDWMYKRGFGIPDSTVLGSNGTPRFQGWSEWMSKRGFGIGAPFAGSSDSEGGQFQQWQNWMAKRGFGIGGPFPGSADGDKQAFQQWQDWSKKRGWDTPVNGFGGGPGAPSFQSWVDFTKRQQFDPPSASFGKGNFQNWNNWYKRQLDGSRAEFGKHQFGSRDEMINYQNLYKKSLKKRQLGYAPERFGVNRYFANGLQDWRSTFKGVKRSKANEAAKSNDQ
ncbi:uncharacterized protein LOC101861311 [Aplysia californica]|uniref:Uncharacterized protein LOC101861311 n=1 Tax=Aplysia californica TaxID=6500 RepID=A0ABM1A7W9_APLCA|nr:uncharacterized protein LOC101861311 [Aplysia californica]